MSKEKIEALANEIIAAVRTEYPGLPEHIFWKLTTDEVIDLITRAIGVTEKW